MLVPKPSSPEVPATPEQLCRQCGLCCDGALFSHAPLQEHEVARVEALSLPVAHREDGSPALELGCAAFRGESCAIYDLRPRACRRFNCRLHAAMSDGEVSWDEAAQLVARAQEHIAQVGQVLAGAVALPPQEESARAMTASPAFQVGTGDDHPLVKARRLLGAGQVLTEEAHAAWDRAERFLDLHFRHARSRIRPLPPG